MALLDLDAASTPTDSLWDYGEARFSLIDYINRRIQICIWFWRGNVLRVISYRKASDDEQNINRQDLHR